MTDIKKVTTTSIKRKLRSTNWVALAPGEQLILDEENIVFTASSDNSGIVYLRRTPRNQWIAKSRTIGNGITVST